MFCGRCLRPGSKDGNADATNDLGMHDIDPNRLVRELLLQNEENKLIRPEIVQIVEAIPQAAKTTINRHLHLWSTRQSPLGETEVIALFAAVGIDKNGMEKIWACCDRFESVHAWSVFANTLKHNTTLMELQLVGMLLNPDACAVFGRAFQDNSTMQVLIVSRSSIEDGNAFGHIFQSSSLKRVVLSFCHLRDTSDMGAFLIQNKVLEELELTYDCLGGASGLARGLRGNTGLRKLDLSGNTLSEGSQQLMGSLSTNETLHVLSLSRSRLYQNDTVTNMILHPSTRLRKLDLSENRIDNEGAVLLGNQIEETVSLEELILRNNRIGNVGSQAIGKALGINRSIQVIDLSMNVVGDGGAFHIGNGLAENGTLTTLLLGRNQIGDFGCMTIGHALDADTLCRLEVLHLSRNRIGDVSCRALGNSLVSNRYLMILKLDRKSMEDDGGNALGRALRENRALLELWLEHNAISDAGGAAIGQGLARNPRLRKLWLGNNRIGDMGSTEIGMALRSNDQLESLGLDYNQISDDGALSIGRGLEQHQALFQLWMSWNQVRSAGLAGLVTGLRLNKSLRDLRLESNGPFDDGSMRALGSALGENTGLTELWLCHCHLEDSDLCGLVSGLSTNSTLRTIRLEFNRISLRGLEQALPILLNHNHTICNVGLSNNDSNSDTDNGGKAEWNKLLASMNSVLYRNKVGLWRAIRHRNIPMGFWPHVIHSFSLRKEPLELCFTLLRNRPDVVLCGR